MNTQKQKTGLNEDAIKEEAAKSNQRKAERRRAYEARERAEAAAKARAEAEAQAKARAEAEAKAKREAEEARIKEEEARMWEQAKTKSTVGVNKSIEVRMDGRTYPSINAALRAAGHPVECDDRRKLWTKVNRALKKNGEVVADGHYFEMVG